VPDLRGLDEKGALQKLKEAGLTPKKNEKCSSADQAVPNAKKGHVQCQNPAANRPVAPGSIVVYVLAGK
jgi:beta-lactam-binding protein with PASTA domain